MFMEIKAGDIMLKTRIVLLCASALLLCTAGFLAADDDSNTYVNKTYGFKIKRPGPGWKIQEKPSPENNRFDLYMIDPTSKAVVLVQVSPVIGDTDTTAYRDNKIMKLKDDPKYSNLKKGRKKIAGEKAPGLVVDTRDANGILYTLTQFYLARNSYLYTLQCYAHQKEYKKFSAAFEKTLKTFSFIKISTQTPQGLTGLAGRCGGEVEWLTDWETASKRAREEKKLIIVTAQFYSGFSMQAIDFARVGPFTDPDLIELAGERFIIMKLMKNSDVPFRSEHLYGMGANTFGRALLFVRPDGQVVGDTFSYNPFHLYDYAIETLNAHPEFTGNPVDKTGNRLLRAEAFLKRGELKRASELLENASTFRGLRLKASLFRRMRQGEKALEALKAAKSKKKSGMEAGFQMDEAILLMRMGKTKEAVAQFSKVIKKHPKSKRIPEAMYWLGACRRVLDDGYDKEELWEKLTEAHPASRWAWMAAASILLTGATGSRPARPEWPDEADLEAVRVRKQEAKSLQRIKEAEEEAVSFLLQNQKDDGSWFTPVELGGISDSSIPLRDAINALCGAALLEYRKNSEAAKAVTKSIKFLLKSHREKKKKEPGEYYMDYTCWSHSCMLMFFARCIEAGVGKKSALKSTMKELIKELEQKQRPGGGWSYYISANLSKGYKADDKSISFTTAGVALGLLEAKKSGVPVPREMLRKTLDCLENMRNPNGSFTYFYDHRNNAGRDNNLPGSSGRVPLCELALYRGKRGSLKRIRDGLDIFVRYRHGLSRQQGKALMHTGRHGQGSHYLLFDYFNAAGAVSELPKAERGKYRNTLYELVLGTRTVGGCYVDNPMMGHNCGTAMALLSFQYLKQ